MKEKEATVQAKQPASVDSFTIITSLTGETIARHSPQTVNLSTFGQQTAVDKQMLTSKTSDYGSSINGDYSSDRQLKLQSRQKYVYNSIVGHKSVVKATATNSTSTFSSVLSSPTASSSSSSSTTSSAPVVTNMYPYPETSNATAASGKDLNAYLERFERIYNNGQIANTYSYV